MPGDTSLPRFGRLIFIVVAVLALLSFGRELPSLLIDWYWFQEVDFTQVFLTTLWTKLQVQFAFGLVFFVFFVGTLLPTVRNTPPNFAAFHELRQVLPAVEQIRPLLRLGFVAAGLVIAWLVGQWAETQWLPWLRFRHSVSFGTVDPVFGRDVGYFVFTLPFLKTLAGFAGFILFASGAAAAFSYFVQGQLWARPGFLAISAPARRHLMWVVAGGLVLIAVGDGLARFDLLYSTHGIVSGAGYTDIHATLPGLSISGIVALVGAALVLVESFRRTWRLSLVAVVGTVLAHLVLTQLWPWGLQRFVVAPNEIERERLYIEREISGTRFAYGLADVQEGRFPANETLTADGVEANSATIDNVRLWEVEPLKKTNAQLQEIRTYYDFVDVDNDRYVIDGELRQVALSTRELNPAALPARIWINEHLTYTHGYGVCVAPVNRISPEGLPEYFVKDIPPVSDVPQLQITRPEIYYGELGAEYVFVNTSAQEFDFPSGEENVYAEYSGSGGIPLGGMPGRALFALHFGEPKILLSSDLLPESRILLYRTVRERVSRIAPWLTWEQDPYIVIREDGTLTWMLDGYTTTDRIPYSVTYGRLGNYIRNPVKATVDAYDGTVTLWAVDPDDPLLQSYADIFPNAFAALDSMPDDLRAHMRYPEGIFSVQAQVYATYHMNDPQVFYNKEDLWRPARRQSGGDDGARVAPYFTVMKLAGVGEKEEFILMLPFTPARKENLIAWMSARCDPPNYGKLLVYRFPKQRLVYGPQQIESRINQDTEIAKELTLWNQQGSQVIRGNLLVVPVDSSVVYFQPLYLQSEGQAALPELKRILVAFGDRIAMETTMREALGRVFGQAPERSDAVVARGELSGSSAGGGAGSSAADERLRRARIIYDRAERALRRGDFSTYAREIEALGRLLSEDAP